MAIVVTAAIANYYLAVVCVVLVVIFVIFRWYFLKTAREIKRLEAQGNTLCNVYIHTYNHYICSMIIGNFMIFILARSPMYSHVSMTLQGLPTVRAYNHEEDLVEQFHIYQNRHTQACYLDLATARYMQDQISVITVIYICLLFHVDGLECVLILFAVSS